MTLRYKLSSLSLLALLLLSACFLDVHAVSAQADQVQTKLQVANDAVNQAFNEIAEAENAGANISALLNQLNYALGLLSEAEISNRTGDKDAVLTKVDCLVPIAQEITNSANKLQQMSVASRLDAMYYTIEITVIIVALFILMLLVTWRLIKNRTL